MFTGIVEETGRIHSREGSRLRIAAATVLTDVTMGASIAVNGVCLTVVGWDNGIWEADVVPETYARTNLGSLQSGSVVNLERPLQVNDRFGGHIVQGHIDGVGTIVHAPPQLRVEVTAALSRYIAEKGSVALNGVSLTVAAVGPTWFEVAIIPHTLAVTNLGSLKVGDPLNVEVDIVAKYVERLAMFPEIEKGSS